MKNHKDGQKKPLEILACIQNFPRYFTRIPLFIVNTLLEKSNKKVVKIATKKDLKVVKIVPEKGIKKS